MNESNPWVRPETTKGNRLRPATWKWDVTYITAVKQICDEEEEKWNKRPSFPTLHINLATNQSAYFTEVRRRLKQRIKQLHKENQRHAHQIKPKASVSDS